MRIAVHFGRLYEYLLKSSANQNKERIARKNINRKWRKHRPIINNNGCCCVSERIFPSAPTLSSHFQPSKSVLCSFFSAFAVSLSFASNSFQFVSFRFDAVSTRPRLIKFTIIPMQCANTHKRKHTRKFPLTHLWSSIPSKLFNSLFFSSLFVHYYLRCNFSLALFMLPHNIHKH